MRVRRQKDAAVDRLLRESRPEPDARFVRWLAHEVAEHAPRRVRYRGPLRAAVLTVALVGALTALGGMGYAMSIATDFVVTIKSHTTYAQQPTLQVLAEDAAVDQYGPEPGPPPGTPGPPTTVPGPPTTTPAGKPTTTPGPPTTTPGGTPKGPPHTATQPTVTQTTPSGPGGEVVAATKASSAGAIAATTPGTNEQAIVEWTASSFSAPVTVVVDPTPQIAQPLVSAGIQAVTVTIKDDSGQQIHQLDAPIEILFHAPPPGFVPATSQDGVTFRALAQLDGPPLPDDQQDGFYVDSSGDIHVLTRHVTFFAMVPPAAIKISVSGKRTPPAHSGSFGDPALNGQVGPPKLQVVGATVKRLAGGGDLVRLTVTLDKQAKLAVSLVGPNGAELQLAQQTILHPGSTTIEVQTPAGRLEPAKTYRLQLAAVDFDGQSTTGSATFTAPLTGLAPATTSAQTTTSAPAPQPVAPAQTAPSAGTGPAAAQPGAAPTTTTTTTTTAQTSTSSRTSTGPAPTQTSPAPTQPSPTTTAASSPGATQQKPAAKHKSSTLSRWWHKVPSSPSRWWWVLLAVLVVGTAALSVAAALRKHRRVHPDAPDAQGQT